MWRWHCIVSMGVSTMPEDTASTLTVTFKDWHTASEEFALLLSKLTTESGIVSVQWAAKKGVFVTAYPGGSPCRDTIP